MYEQLYLDYLTEQISITKLNTMIEYYKEQSKEYLEEKDYLDIEFVK